MKVVVTGGAGFIGANLCKGLYDRPDVDHIVAFDDLSTGRASNLDGLPVEFVRGSILDPFALRSVIAGADAVVHLAALPSVPRSIADPMASHEANASGTLRVLEACRQSGSRVVLASSSSVYGSIPDLPKHERLPLRPRSPYAASKLAAEAYALSYGETYQLPVLCFRFFNVYGPLQTAGHAYAAVVPTFIDAVMRGRPITIHGDGQQSRDFTFVGSVAEVLADAAIDGKTCPSPVNLAFGTRTSLLSLIEHLRPLMGRGFTVKHAAERTGDVRDSQASCDLLRSLFPNAVAVPLIEGLAATVEWFRSLPEYGKIAQFAKGPFR